MTAMLALILALGLSTATSAPLAAPAAGPAHGMRSTSALESEPVAPAAPHVVALGRADRPRAASRSERHVAAAVVLPAAMAGSAATRREVSREPRPRTRRGVTRSPRDPPPDLSAV
jgi:hypothetical protein